MTEASSNLSELQASKTVFETFKKEVNALTVQDKGDAEIRDYIKLRKTRPFVVKEQAYFIPKKSLFNRIIGDSHLELEFASFLDDCDDIISFAKNYLGVHFKIDYVNASGGISHYYPFFFFYKTSTEIYIIETKGLVDLDVPLKMARLKQWCDDVNNSQLEVRFDYIFVDEGSFRTYSPTSFTSLVTSFTEYKD